ncbi:MAG: type II toxin-antitoxin system VapC family toxin [Planctomycetota bacterium]
MGGSVLLDSNIVIAIMDQEEEVAARLVGADDLAVSSVVLGELYFGALKSLNVEDNLRRLDEFSTNVAVVGCDAVMGWHYAQVKNGLRTKGRPIPDNDIWIAAQALQHGLTVASRDQHFREIDGLTVEVW